jgi:hypothetical protein
VALAPPTELHDHRLELPALVGERIKVKQCLPTLLCPFRSLS